MEYKKVHNTELHIATLYRRRRPILTARNTIGTRSQGCGYNDQSLHAECAVIKKMGDFSQLKGCTLKVVRIGKQNQIMNSQPCHSCRVLLEKCMKKYGLLRVEYSV